MPNEMYDWLDSESNLKALHGHLMHVHDTLTGREIASDDTLETNAEMINTLTEVIRNFDPFFECDEVEV